ncbi:MAG: hypothetical protein ACP59X_08685 [Solidesulfovibrio sp. DCME]|uniref:hypothetical protein n=1 Tax=Solidesulfovibrio sp. DCME TaxID=3447380 RepID=UPI003D0B7DE6
MDASIALRQLALLLCLLLAALAGRPAGAATGPWTFLTPTPTGNTIHDAYSPDGGTTIYHVGDGGLILKQVGSTFTFMDSGTTAPLKGIAGSGPSDIWAVGGSALATSNADPVRSVLLHFDGTSWTSTTPPTWSGFPDLYPMRDVWVSATGQAWAVSELSSLVSKWNAGSAAWEFETFYDPKLVNYPVLSSVFGFSASDVYAVGSYGTILHRDATSWSAMVQFENVASNTSYNLLRCVWGPDADHVFASGNSGQLYRLIPLASADWSKVNEGGFFFSAYELASMAGTGPDDIWFVGASGVIRRWTGAINDLAVYDDPAYKARTSIISVAGGNYHLTGTQGLLQAMNGTTAARTDLNVPVAALTPWRAVTFAGKLWLAPRWSSPTSGVSTFSGGQLTKHPITNLSGDTYVTAFKAFSPTDFWFSGLDSGNAVLLRGNGTAWSSWLPPGVYGAMSILDVVKATTGAYALIQAAGSETGMPCIVGSQYMECPTSLGADAYLYAGLAAATGGDVYAVGTAGRVARWHDGAWSVATIGANGDNLAAVAAGGGAIVAVGQNGCAFFTTDGSNWQPVSGVRRLEPVDGYSLYDFTNIVHAGGGVFWAVLTSNSRWTDGGKSSLYRIENGQATLVQGGYTNILYALAAAADQQAAFAAGEGGVIMTTNAGFHETGPPLPFLPLLLQGQ